MIYEFGQFQLDPLSRRLEPAGGQAIELPGKAFDALVYLLERAGRPVARHELLQTIWPSAADAESALERAIADLRAALGDASEAPRFIEPLSGGGYRFICNVASTQPEPTSPSDAPLTITWLIVAICGFLVLALIAVLAGERGPFG